MFCGGKLIGIHKKKTKEQLDEEAKQLKELLDKKLAEAVGQGKNLGLKRVYHEDYVPIINAKQWLKDNRKKK